MSGLERSYRYGQSEGWTNKMYDNDIIYGHGHTNPMKSLEEMTHDEIMSLDCWDHRLTKISNWEYKKYRGHYRKCESRLVTGKRESCTCAGGLTDILGALKDMTYLT